MIRRPPRSTLFPSRRSSDLTASKFALELQKAKEELATNEQQLQTHETAYGNRDRKSTRLNSSHSQISYAVFCLKKKKKKLTTTNHQTRPTVQVNIVTS